MTAAALFVLRQRDGPGKGVFRAPGHPFTTGVFVLACAGTVAGAIASAPANSAIALAILAVGMPVYWYWK